MKNNNKTMMQYFEWYLPNNCNLWKNIIKVAPDLHKMGITSVWLPPACKCAGGINDTGYGVYDLYDLGEFNQKGTVRTKYGTKDEYIAAIRALQLEDIQVLADIVLNHRMGADEMQDIISYKVNPQNRNEVIGDLRTISAWTKYNFEGRNNVYSDFKLDWSHFTAIDYDNKSCGKILILIANSGEGPKKATIVKGNSLQGTEDLEVSVTNSKTVAIVIESGKFENVSGENKGKVVIKGEDAESLKVQVIELP